MTDPIVSFINMLKTVQKILPVLVVFKYRFLFIAAGGDMINCAGIFYAERTCHGATLAEMIENFKEKDLALDPPLFVFNIPVDNRS